MSAIKFGTDGWRAIMCEEFIFSNVEIVVQAVCDYLKAEGKAERGLVIGYDTRFFSDRFARRAAQVCCGNGIKVYLSHKDCPTPVTAYSILRLQTAGALMITASHNPPEYNGIKYIPDNAAPALPEVTGKIEAMLNEVEKTGRVISMPLQEAKDKKLLEIFDPTDAYMKALKKIIDLTAISRGKLKVVYDALYATGRNYVPLLLEFITDFSMIHGQPDPYFGGKMPEPKVDILQDLINEVSRTGAHLGLANDGDADRFGVIDSDGSFINPNQVITLVYMHLLKNRGIRGSVARSVATTHLVDRIARDYGCTTVETPVGFKYIGNELLKDGVIIGGEESGGLSIEGHIPEKDGILALALITEIRSVEGKPLQVLLEEIYRKYGTYYSKRVDIHCEQDHISRFFTDIGHHLPQQIAGLKVVRHSDIDGFKFYLEDDSWILFRPSGTEPLVRIYMEARSKECLKELSSEATRIFEMDSRAVEQKV
jgi:alpha-D-glucose phosphate-specific phosphoglucomutase